MCGIVGYVGKREAAPLLLEGLKRLEYRGYDSAGICVADGENKLMHKKNAGRVDELVALMNGSMPTGSWGIAHTRWATHGVPNTTNAHPHPDCHDNIFVVHNGIIENFRELKAKLIKEGHKFKSDTDTEVLSHLIEKFYKNSLEDAVIKALKLVRGAYGIAVIAQADPGKIVAVKNSSPIVVGLGDGEAIVASDASAILTHTKQVVYLNDGEIAVVTADGVTFTNLARQKLSKKPETLEWGIEAAEKGGYEHFMLKEIFEQPESLANTLRGHLVEKDGTAKLGGIDSVADRLGDINRIILVACGSASYAALLGKYMLEEYTGIPCEVVPGSEFRYRKPILDKHTAFVCISQSGETADTLVSLQEAKEKGIVTLGIVNVIGSAIARETDAGIYIHSGPELAVATTKALTSQFAALALLTLYLGRKRGMSLVTGQRIVRELKKMPELIKKVLETAPDVKRLAKKYYKSQSFFFTGRKYQFPIALEGAIKLKEISYIHAEGLAGGELKHGPITLIDKDFPTFGIVLKDSVYEKTFSNLEEIKARGGPILAIATEGDQDILKITKDVIYIPKTLEMLSPILSVIPLQLFAYYCAVYNKRDVDKPRNLAKSVTVE
ncbi:MAG: glutamine--fructose-6-phosphate transaminase (isomerizing) [Patescibacteria group bacterium]